MKRKIVFRSAIVAVLLVSIAAVVSYFQQQKPVKVIDELTNVYGINPTATFEPVLPNHPVELPRDFAFHPEFQNEKWQYFATLTDKQGNPASIQWTVIRVSRDESLLGGWKNSQLFVAQVVVSYQHRVWKQQRLARGGVGQAGLRTRPFRLWIDNWSWNSLGIAPLPGILKVATDDFSFSLKSLATSPFLLAMDNGYQQEQSLLPIASYQFFMPRIRVAGKLQINGKPFDVAGNASLTKEWHSDPAIEKLQTQTQIDVQLDDGRYLKIKHNKLPSLPVYSYGTIVDKEGKKLALNHNEIKMKPTVYTRLANGKLLPLEWQISIAKERLSVTIKALNNEMWHDFIQPYWQGPITVSGSSSGKGSLKLSGY